MKKHGITTLTLFAVLTLACTQAVGLQDRTENGKKEQKMSEYKVQKTDSEWRAELTDEEFYILRQKGTERAFTGKYWDNKESGTYVCAGCGHQLFESDTKFRSGSGWPSFYKPIKDGHVAEESDLSHGMRRTEVLCGNCGGHLGHVFNDAPGQPTGLRYCINSASLDFVDEDGNKDDQ